MEEIWKDIRLEKCKIALEKGYKYDPESGVIFGIKGKEITRKGKGGYIDIAIHFNGKYHHLMGHQFAWYCIYNEVVDTIDHIDGNRLNNKKNNLRSITHKQNVRNRNLAKGYYYSKEYNKFYAQICVDYKHISLGGYNTEEEARQAYLNAKEKYHIID
jgi:hypothetical protein